MTRRDDAVGSVLVAAKGIRSCGRSTRIEAQDQESVLLKTAGAETKAAAAGSAGQ